MATSARNGLTLLLAAPFDVTPVKVRQILLGGSKKMILYNDMETSEKIKVYDSGVSFTDDPQKIYDSKKGLGY